jgi:dihydrofolate reductase
VFVASLIYSAITSLDGYIEDASGGFEWAAPDEQVHAFVNDVERSVGTNLYGRRMYETMRFWETLSADADEPAVMHDFARIWQAADKIVYSRTLEVPSSARTTIERNFDSAAVRRLKESARSDISIGGPELAGQAIAAGLVDEYRVFLSPVAVGGGKPALPHDARIQLELLEERRFAGGVVYLRYKMRR